MSRSVIQITREARMHLKTLLFSILLNNCLKHQNVLGTAECNVHGDGIVFFNISDCKFEEKHCHLN